MKIVDIQSLNFVDGLIPAIVQDHKSGRVLMLGYMNAESIEETFNSGKVTFYSRSKQRLWTKGESSGNYLNFKSMAMDCDADALLVKAKPTGPVCHLGDDTCWKEKNSGLNSTFKDIAKLEEVIDQRLQGKGSKKSYIRDLSKRGTNKIAQKVGEEAVELVIESGKDDDHLFLEEAADLLFHYLVLLHDRGYALKDVEKILKGRHIKRTKK